MNSVLEVVRVGRFYLLAVVLILDHIVTDPCCLIRIKKSDNITLFNKILECMIAKYLGLFVTDYSGT